MTRNTKTKNKNNSSNDGTDNSSISNSRRAYLRFRKLHRHDILNANPSASEQELNQLISNAFLQLDQEEKDQVQDLPKEGSSRPFRMLRPSYLQKAPDGRYKKKSVELLHKRTMRNIFGNRYKSKIMKANRHIPIGEVSIMAGKAFREITQEEEAKLSEQAHALLITMTKNAIKFGRDLQHGRAKAKEKNAKKQHSVFPFFFKQQRQNIIDENPGLTNTQIMKKAGEMYRNLGEEEKDQVRWEAEQLRNNVLGEKVPPPLSSFMLFKEEKMAAYTEKFPYKSKQDIMQLIGWEWRITPNTIKAKFKNESVKAWEKYRITIQSREEEGERKNDE